MWPYHETDMEFIVQIGMYFSFTHLHFACFEVSINASVFISFLVKGIKINVDFITYVFIEWWRDSII